MRMNPLPTSVVIDDHVPALSAPQSHVRRVSYRIWRRVAHYLLTHREVARQRRGLLALDELALKDVGISRIDALREANRNFWDLPKHLKPHREMKMGKRNHVRANLMTWAQARSAASRWRSAAKRPPASRSSPAVRRLPLVS